MLEYIILGTLYQQEMTGYDIRKCIEAGIGMFYKASYGSIYPLLKRLLDLEMVTCSQAADSSRKQKIYVITESGKRCFDKWLAADENEDYKIEMFMAKVYFFDQLNEEQASKQISGFQKRAEAYLSELLHKREQFLYNEHKDDFYFKLSTLYFGIVKLQGILSWCEVVKNRTELETFVETKV